MASLTTYQIISLVLSIVGVPSLATVIGWVHSKQKKAEAEQAKIDERQKQETQALKLGVQALLRSQMINDYNKWSDKGYAPIYARENFQNCWIQYESLGENGVMEDIRNKFMDLPTSRKNVERQ